MDGAFVFNAALVNDYFQHPEYTFNDLQAVHLNPTPGLPRRVEVIAHIAQGIICQVCMVEVENITKQAVIAGSTRQHNGFAESGGLAVKVLQIINGIGYLLG
jgi:hypothetical protein